MELYKITGRFSYREDKEYIESIDVIRDLQETPKTYSNKGTRILKSDVGVLRTGFLRDGMEFIARNEEEIEQGRRLIWTQQLEETTKQLMKYQKRLASIENHSLDTKLISTN